MDKGNSEVSDRQKQLAILDTIKREADKLPELVASWNGAEMGGCLAQGWAERNRILSLTLAPDLRQEAGKAISGAMIRAGIEPAV